MLTVLGGRFSLSTGSFPVDLHLEPGSEGLSKGHMGPLLSRQVCFLLMRAVSLADASEHALRAMFALEGILAQSESLCLF